MPDTPAIGAAIGAVMVLLVEQVALGAGDVVDAMADLAPAWGGGVVVMAAGIGIGDAVAARP